MITSGKITDIQKNLSQNVEDRRILYIRLSSRKEACEKFLLEQIEIEEVRVVGDYFRFNLKGSEEIQITLLQKLIQQNFPVLEYKLHNETLEDIFMKLTKGEVQ
jgi:hypothetical protein